MKLRLLSLFGTVNTSLLTILFAAASAAAVPSPCQPRSEDVRAALRELGLDWLHPMQIGNSENPCSPGLACWSQRLEQVSEILERYPNEFLLHRLHHDLVWQQLPHGPRISVEDQQRIDEIRGEYSEKANAEGASAAEHYLWSRVAPDGDERIEHLERALEVSSEFPWPHLELALVAAGRNDPDQALRHLEAFSSVCPDRFSEILFYRWRLWLWKPDVFALERSELEQLRALVEAAPLAWRARDLPVLWPLEFGAASIADHEVVRDRIRNDLASIENEDLDRSESNFFVWRTLNEGYAMLGSSEAADRVEETLLASYPCSEPAVRLRQERWDGAHPRPAEASIEFERAQYDAAVEWSRLCPDEYSFRSRRFRSFVNLPDIHPDRLVEESEGLLRVADLYLDRYRYKIESPYREAANALVDHRVRPDLAVDFLDRESEMWSRLFHEEPIRELPVDLPENETVRSVARHSRWLHHEIALSRALVQTGELDRASRALDGVGSALDEVEKRASSKTPAILLEGLYDAFNRARGDLSVARHELLDALAFYRGVDETAAHEIWGSLGGSPEGWHAWSGVTSADEVSIAAPEADPAAPSLMAEADTEETDSGELVVPAGWVAVDVELSWSELTDLKGRQWTLEDLEGKMTLVNFWATWCMPCRPEFPVLNDLHRRIRSRSDIQIVSISTDANTGVVGPFTSRFDLSYPVIPAPEFARRNGINAIPTNWVIGPEGSVLYRTSGAEVVKRGWVETTIAFLESLSDAGVTE